MSTTPALAFSHRARRAAEANGGPPARPRPRARGAPHPPWLNPRSRRRNPSCRDRLPMAAAAASKRVVRVKPGGARRPPVVLSSRRRGVVVRAQRRDQMSAAVRPRSMVHPAARASPPTNPPRARRRRSLQRWRRRSRQRARRGAAQLGTSAAGRCRARFACRGRRPGRRRAPAAQGSHNVPASPSTESSRRKMPGSGRAARTAGGHGRVRGRAGRRQGTGRGDPRVPVGRQRNRSAERHLGSNKCDLTASGAPVDRVQEDLPAAAARNSC